MLGIPDINCLTNFLNAFHDNLLQIPNLELKTGDKCEVERKA